MKNLAVKNEELLEELPSHSKMRPAPKAGRVYPRYEDRWYNFPYSKIERFLKSNVGNVWDDVYSKYCHLEWLHKRFKNREWAERNIIVNTFMKDGKVWHVDSNGEYPIGEYRYGRQDTYYIHPKTKLLCLIKHKPSNYSKKYAEKEAKTMRILGDYHQLLKINGIWYEVRGKPKESDIIEIDGLHYRHVKCNVPPMFGSGYKNINGKWYVPCQDRQKYLGKPIGPRDRMILNREDIPLSWRLRNDDSITITLYRQLNSKDLHKYGLKNDVVLMGKVCKKCGGEVGKVCIFHVCTNCGKYKGEDCKCPGWL